MCTASLIHLVLLSEGLPASWSHGYHDLHGQSGLIYFVPTNWIDADFLWKMHQSRSQSLNWSHCDRHPMSLYYPGDPLRYAFHIVQHDRSPAFWIFFLFLFCGLRHHLISDFLESPHDCRNQSSRSNVGFLLIKQIFSLTKWCYDRFGSLGVNRTPNSQTWRHCLSLRWCRKRAVFCSSL